MPAFSWHSRPLARTSGLQAATPSAALPYLPAATLEALRGGKTPVPLALRKSADAHVPVPDETLDAVASGETAAVQAWLRGGGHVDARTMGDGDTMLLAASTSGDDAMVAALLQRGASVDLQNKTGGTALMGAAGMGCPAIVRQLLAAGADPALRDEDGDTAADWAESEGHAAILEILAARRVRLEPPLLCRSALPSSTQLPASSGVAVLEGQGRGRPPEAEGAPPHTLRPPKARRRRRVDADARAVARLHLPLN